MATVFKRRVRGKLTKKYYIKFKNANGRWQVVVGTASKEDTTTLAKKLESDATLERHGVAVKTDLKSELPLRAFKTYLSAKGGGDSHISLTMGQLRSIFTACGFVKLNDLRQSDAADKVDSYLKNKRQQSKRRQLKETVKRRRTVAREPEKLVPISTRTKNAYIASLKSFCKWCVATGKIPDCRLTHLKRLKGTAEPSRRAATDAEVRSLLKATKAGGHAGGLTSRDRWFLYRTALATGFRASELASLYPAAFKLKGKLPHISLAAPDAKNRKAAEQPLRPEFAAELATWLKGRAASEPVWPGNWYRKAAEMLRSDLLAAGVPYEVGGRVLDYHGLRVTFITSLARAGVHPKTAQILARHGDINLTMKFYTHLSLEEVAAVLPPAVSE